MPRQVTHKMPDPKRLEAKTKIADILRTLPYEEGFHFYTALDTFTGETAESLYVFEKKLQVVPANSVNFHLQRGDFQKWIKVMLGDDELARRVSLIKLTLPVEDLRKELLAIVKTRITELKRELPHHLRHAHS